MAKHYTTGDLESFVKGMIEVARILREENPDHFLAPITGAVPFVDLLAIVDQEFDYQSTQYVPSTSKFNNLVNLMQNWYDSYVKSIFAGEQAKTVTVDEVVSGSSTLRAITAFNKAKSNLANALMKERGSEEYLPVKLEVDKKLPYVSIGLVDESKPRRDHRGYRRAREKGLIREVPVKRILTMDYPPLCPLKLKVDKESSNGRLCYSTVGESFEVSSEYNQLLQDVASFMGVDPQSVSPVNVVRIGNFRDHLSPEFLK